ncbi:hypothetical protein LUZ61_013463 [Rhynchospora tenuis]|uniref:Uncharacterized protein n=1 Tax=Rhynchospora tenuis TaxID=198213 RepID=A0AAD5W9L3_9POAL|nr:hypothetical protein LUZ61_013463 [Rhynchospora tenuis]
MDGSTVVSTVVKIVGEKLGSSAFKELGLIWGVKDDLEELEGIISTVRDVVANAEDRCLIKDNPLYNWLRELKDVFYDADDLLDKIYWDDEKWKVKPYGQTSKFIGSFISNVNPIKRLKLAHKIQSVNKKLSIIADKKANFHLPSMVVGSREETYFKNRETFSEVDEDDICGRDTELQDIIRQLKHTDANENISIISIVGLGGLGKTTLAQLIYNNEDELNEYFKPKMWVYVSQDFDVKRIVTAMIESISESKCELKYLNTLVKKITEELTGKRFLLILDDIWNENQEYWGKLEIILKCGAPGSKIIATTRSEGVSKVMKSTYTCNLNGLSEEMSWNLFKKKAFSRSKEELNSQILEIAKEIVEKCGGVPLALKTLGSTMHNKSVEKWKAIRNSEIWKTNDEVMASLELSYMNLSSELKECFAYCSIFPKGHVIYKEELIGQWMANGLVSFTRSTGGTEDDLGNEYFEQLVQVSFLQNVVEQSYSTTVTCNMHDLVHDLARSISNQRILLINDADKAINKDNGKVNPTKIKKLRALHISSGDSSVISMVSRAQNLRSLTLERIELIGTLPMSFKKLIHLRRIYISNCSIDEIPNDIGTLWSLEALHLRDCWMIKYLPESIGKLFNIKTLKLNNLYKFTHLPESIGKLDKLCSLNLHGCESLEKVPESIGDLINLESLDLKQCENLKYLSGSIGKLDKLCSLNLDGCNSLEKVPESIGDLINLESLDLKLCKNLKYLPESIGKLDKLCSLNLDSCNSLEKVPESIGNLINLRSLYLHCCENLKYLPESIGKLTNLCVLNLNIFFLNTIPKSIYNLTKLSSLNLDRFQKFSCMPAGICNINGPDIEGSSFFSGVKENELGSISELEHLNIRGDLEIYELQNLNNPREATQANLKKKNLNGLKLSWNSHAILNDCIECSLPLLEALQPPSSIESLNLEGYPGEQYPNWMMLSDETRMTLFPNLTSLTLSHIKSCSNLPSLVGLPHLQYLKLEGMLNLTTISGHFPSLVDLYLCEMPNLEEVTTMNLDTENVYKPAFPHLSKLEISGCPKVRIKPHLPPSVVELKLKKINEEQLLEVEYFNGESSSEICSQPLGIRELRIIEMGTELVLLKHLSSLTRLQFQNCERNCLPESMRYLSSLRELEIYSCKGLHALPEWLGELKSLERLVIWFTPLTCLPESMKHVSSLRKLWFWNCKGLRVLPDWFGELKSLKYLDIAETPLTCLPKSMKQLTALQYLSVWKCPELERRCEREKGEDWHLISHIPHVDIWSISNSICKDN